jgi:hypothetical protein
MGFSPAFQTALDAGETFDVLTKVVYSDGTVVRFTTGVQPITWDGEEYLPDDFISISPMASGLGSKITTLNFTGQMGGRITQDDVIYRWPLSTWIQYAVFPVFDPARPDLIIGDATIGEWMCERGTVAGVQILDDLQFEATFEGPGRQIAIATPNTIVRQCPLILAVKNELGYGCPVDPATIEHTVTPTSVSPDGLTIEFTVHPIFGFDRGFMKALTGTNVGTPRRGIKSATHSGDDWTCVLYDTFPNTVLLTDSLLVREGCDGLKTTCDVYNPADADHSAGWPFLGDTPPGRDWLSANK